MTHSYLSLIFSVKASAHRRNPGLDRVINVDGVIPQVSNEELPLSAFHIVFNPNPQVPSGFVRKTYLFQ